MKPFKHLLVIRLSALGDVAMTVPIIAALRKQHPDTKITVLTKAFYVPLFLKIPDIEVYIAEVDASHKGVFGLWRLYKELRALDIDAIADLHHVLRSLMLTFYFKMAGIRVAHIDKGRAEKKILTARTKHNFRPLKSTHQRYIDVFNILEFDLDLADVIPLPKQQLGSKSAELIATKTKKIIGIAPFAAFEGKMYPLHLMEEVILALSSSSMYRILLFGGGESEMKQLDLWENQFENTSNISGKLTFEEELAAISNLDVMLSMDSGNGHLAAMYGVSTLTLWGVTHPYTGFTPLGQPFENSILADSNKFPLIPTSVYGNKWPLGYEKAMETISPEKILQKLNQLLA